MAELVYDPMALMAGAIIGNVAGTLLRVPIVSKGAAVAVAAAVTWGVFTLEGGPAGLASLVARQLSEHASSGALYGVLLGHGVGVLLAKIARDAGGRK